MNILPVQDLIPETNIVVFAPHYDDFLLGIGGYVLELKAQNLLSTKRFHILLIFSRSNYQARSGSGELRYQPGAGQVCHRQAADRGPELHG